MTPRISVALPVRNGANYIAAALDSILAQTMADFELVVSDNASTDETNLILGDYCARDARIKVSRSEQLLPLGANMNRAVGLASTPWVKLFCHDDLMRPDCLAVIVEAIDQTQGRDLLLLCNGDRHLFENGHITSETKGSARIERDGRDTVRRFLAGSLDCPLPSVTTATVNRTAFDAIGGFDQRFEHFDTFCWLRLLMTTGYIYLPDTLTTIRVHGEQVTTASRRALGWATDYHKFLAEFVAAHGQELGLSTATRLRVGLKPSNIAAKSLVSEMRAGRWSDVRSMIGKMPYRWLPLLPPLVARAWLIERRRTSTLKGVVSPDLISP